jgi:hypothetical protein
LDYRAPVHRFVCLLGIAASLLVWRPASAQEDEQEPEEGIEESPEQAEEEAAASDEQVARSPEDDAFGHSGQFGLRFGIVGGMRMVFRYDETALCVYPDAGEPQRFCGHAAPLALEPALSFAPLDSLEPFVWGRFGLSEERQTNTDPLVILGLGLRLYTMSDSRFKVFLEPAVGWELEGREGGPRDASGIEQNAEYKKDLIFHIVAGMQYDFAPAVGAFVDAGLTTGVLRALHTTLEIQAGLQVRAPEIY